MNKILKFFGFSEEINNTQVESKETKSKKNNTTTDNSDIDYENFIRNLNLDELFVHNFTKAGGSFIFCTKKQEISIIVENILKENNWKNFVANEEDIKQTVNLNSLISKNGSVFISSCDNLIADNGKIMISSNQGKNHSFKDLPNKHIIIATPSQIVANMSEGLSNINKRYRKNLPSKITTICSTQEVNDNRETNQRTIFLILLEDYS